MVFTKYVLMPVTLFLLLVGLTANPAQAVTTNVTLDDLSEQYLNGPGQGAYGTHDWNITNSTGVSWTDFHLWDAEAIGFWNEDSFFTNQGTWSYGLSSDSSHYQFNVVGLNIADGGVFSFSFTEACTGEVCSLGGIILRGYPTTGGVVDDTSAVPEPSTLLLIGSGLASIVLYNRKVKSKS